jgi:predicted permease
MLQDLRHGVRLLLNHKGWTAVLVLSLALGIGANTALFSAVNGQLLRTIPVQSPGELVRFKYVGREQLGTNFNEYGYTARDPSGQDVRSTFPYAIYQEFLKANQTMSDVLASAPRGQLNVVVDGQAEIARGFLASGNYYRALGVPALAGRTLLPEDDAPGAGGAAVISEGYWRRRFGGSPDAIGKAIQVNNTPVTIVGVTAAAFTGIQQPLATAPDITLPLNVQPRLEAENWLTQQTTWWLQIMGRLKPGVTAPQVQGNLEGAFQQSARSGWERFMAGLSERERGLTEYQTRTSASRLRVDDGSRGIYDTSQNDLRSMTLLGVVVGLLLLIVCANVANLLLARATARQREISVRLSTGATRGRLVRQLLTESVLLAALGGLAGLGVGWWARYLLPSAAAPLPNASALPPFDWRLYLFVTLLSLVTGAVFGIAPALRATDVSVHDTLKASGRSVIGSRRLLSRALLVLQVALSLVLLVGAGLFLTTLSNLRKVDVGFDTRNLLLFRVDPRLNQYDQARIADLYARLLERLRAVPGVRNASLSQPGLLTGSTSTTNIYIEGRAYGERGDPMYQVTVSPTFFETLGIPLLAGRTLTARDDEKAPKVVAINESAARQYFEGNAIGRRFGRRVEERQEWQIVGVVRDARYNSLRDAPPPTVYWPYVQRCCPGAVFEVRTASDPSGFVASIREAVRQVDPNLPLMNVVTQAESIETRLNQERLFARAYALFGGLALLLASIGLFGLMSYNVARRTNEIGIRMALGATRAAVLGLVMRESQLLVVIGVAIGLTAALVAGRLVRTLLFGLEPTDMTTIAAAIVVMVAVSAFAGFLPARRAAQVDPMVALRYE